MRGRMSGGGRNLLRRNVRRQLSWLCEVRGRHVPARCRMQRHVHGSEELRRGRLRYRHELPGRVQRRSIVRRGSRHRDHHQRDVHRQGCLQDRRLWRRYVHSAMQRKRLQGAGRELLREELHREWLAQRTVQHVIAASAHRLVPGSRGPLSPRQREHLIEPRAQEAQHLASVTDLAAHVDQEFVGVRGHPAPAGALSQAASFMLPLSCCPRVQMQRRAADGSPPAIFQRCGAPARDGERHDGAVGATNPARPAR